MLPDRRELPLNLTALVPPPKGFKMLRTNRSCGKSTDLAARGLLLTYEQVHVILKKLEIPEHAATNLVKGMQCETSLNVLRGV